MNAPVTSPTTPAWLAIDTHLLVQLGQRVYHVKVTDRRDDCYAVEMTDGRTLLFTQEELIKCKAVNFTPAKPKPPLWRRLFGKKEAPTS